MYVCISVYVFESETEIERESKYIVHRYDEQANKVARTACLEKCSTIDIVLHTASIFRTHLWSCDNTNNIRQLHNLHF